MSDTPASLRRKIGSAEDLQSVVRTMKAVAAASIGQYEKSVNALLDYDRSIELGLGACLREISHAASAESIAPENDLEFVGAVVFGSDQGLVGQFNEVIADYTVKTLASLPGKPQVLAVGERVASLLTDAGLVPIDLFPVPASVNAITPLVGRLQVESERRRARQNYSRVFIFHNRPETGSLYEPVSQRMLPLDVQWQTRFSHVVWPTSLKPEVVEGSATTLRALIREYLFISLFRACSESLASENASRLAAMQRADKNIGDSLNDLNRSFHRLRQDGIDEELFDVTSGFEALAARLRR